ncbi:MAG: divergent PAP2 family protein [Patescibacteria group bacterium]
MHDFILTYQLLWIPIAVIIITQLIKVALESFQTKSFEWKQLNGYGGMPSSHTAFVTSLMMITGLEEGVESAAFAIAFVFGVIVIRDAVGLRRYLGEQGEMVNEIVDQLHSKKLNRLPELRETLGHTYAQGFVGMICGILLTLLLRLAIL